MKTISELRKEKYKSKSKNIKWYSGGFYQSKKWKRIREKSRKAKRAEHEEIVLEVFQQNLDKNNPADLLEFIYDPKNYPLSEKSLKEGIIKRANTLDHIKPIKLGGSKLSPSNLQWLTSYEHFIKTKQEGK